MCDQPAQIPSGKVPKNAEVLSAPRAAAVAVAAADDASSAARSTCTPPATTDENRERKARRSKKMRKKPGDALKVSCTVMYREKRAARLT